jgi:hypothetical protein
MQVHFMILALKVTSLYQASKCSFGNKKVSFLLKLILCDSFQEFITYILEWSKPTVRALVFDSVNMFATNYLLALNAAERFNASLITNDTRVACRELKI